MPTITSISVSNMRWLVFCQVILAWMMYTGLINTAKAAVHPALSKKRGMVASDHALASLAGVEILRQGGNAVDAACAAMFALSVVNPSGSGLGGGGFMLVFLKTQKNKVDVLDFREQAPAAARSNTFLQPGLARTASQHGGLAVAIPGEVKGCEEAIQRYGKLDLKRVLVPAIRLAKEGFAVGQHLASISQSRRGLIARFPTLARVFLPQGQPLRLGQWLKRPRLAKTFATIAQHGSRGFYEGWVAQDIVDTVRKHGGILTLQDLSSYRVIRRTPLTTNYRDHQIFTMPPPSSGGIVIIQSLNVLRHFPLLTMGQNSSEYLHLLSEVLQHAFADRARFLGDADFVKVPLAWLTSQKYASQLKQRISPKVQPRPTYGTRVLPGAAAHRGGGTSHLSVVDSFGNAVALTTTINTAFGSKVMAPRSGIILNNEMDDFTTHPGKPNAYGLVQSPLNQIAPGKRPLSSMAPTIVLYHNQPRLILGGSGGPTIITGTLQVLLNVIDFGLELADAVSRSRIHHQWIPQSLAVERDLPQDVVQNLQKRGHRTFSFRKPFTAIQAVEIRNQRKYGASDPRKYGRPAGY